MHTVKLGAFRRLMRGAFDCVPRPGFLPVSRARALRSMVARHLLDSLAVIPYLYGKRLLDIGSGAGIRAWCWLSRIPIVEWVLLDRSLKKIRCLRQVLLVRHRRLSNRPMKSAIAELREAQEDLQSIAGRIAAERVAGPLAALKRTATEIGEAWSGSFLGYHALVYYKGLKPPPPGAHFSSEWGLRDAFNMGTRGAWEEWGFDAVKNEILRQAGSLDLTQVRETSTALREHFEERYAQILSVLETTIARRKDPFLERLLEDAKKTGPITATEYIRYQQPSGRLMSRDTLALTQGLWTPPHIAVLAEVEKLRSPGPSAASLVKLVRQAANHLERVERDQHRADRLGTNVFIGHGRSPLWKDLKDFVQDRLRLPWDEFNRVPVAG